MPYAYQRDSGEATWLGTGGVSKSFATLPGVGTLVVVHVVGVEASGVDPATNAVTDNQGNTYTRAVFSRSGTQFAALYYAYNVASSGTFTVSYASGGINTRGSLIAVAYTGCPTTDPLDKTATSIGTDPTFGSGTTATLSQADELGCASFIIFNATFNTATPSSGWTNRLVEFGGASAQAGIYAEQVLSSTAGLQCQETVNDLGGTTTTNGCIATFKAAPAPTVTNTSPSSGPTAGGTAVTITGTGFQNSTPGTNAVTIKGVSATGVSVTNDTTITCTTGAGTAGVGDVVVTNNNGTGTQANGFTYTSFTDFGRPFGNRGARLMQQLLST